MDSDIVAFESLSDDSDGSHCAILLDNNERGAFPPNTLFRLKEVIPKGEWLAPGGKDVYPQQVRSRVWAVVMVSWGCGCGCGVLHY
jgi:hypothetical protein